MAAVPAATKQSAARPLKVEFTDLHYECEKSCLQQGRENKVAMWGYYSMHTLMRVENVSADKTLDSPWMVTRWILTDGTKTWGEPYAWQFVRGDGDTRFYDQPSIPPGGKNEWTWMAFPIPFGAWVGGIEYRDQWGNTYSQDLAKPAFGESNYMDCGAPFEGNC